MLNTVLDAKKKEPTEETEEEYVKPPVLETRVLHIQEEEPNVTKAELAPRKQQNKEPKEDPREKQAKTPTLETNIVSPWVPAGAGMTNCDSVMCLPQHLDVGTYVQDLKQGRKRSPAGTLSSPFTHASFDEMNSVLQYLETKKLTPNTTVCLNKLAEFVGKKSVSMTTFYDSGIEFGRHSYHNRIPVTFIYHLADVFSKVEKDAQSRTHTIKAKVDQIDLSDLESETSDQEHCYYLDHGTEQ